MYLSIFLSVYLSIFLFIYLSMYLSIYQSIYLFIYLSIYLSAYLSIYLSVCLSTCFTHLNVQKCLNPLCFYRFDVEMCFPPQCRTLRTRQFLRFLCAIELWLQSRAHFSSKRSSNASVFRVFFCEIEPSLQSCARFVDNFCRSRPETVETETLIRRPRKPLYPKKHRVSRPIIFSSLNSCVPGLLHIPTI